VNLESYSDVHHLWEQCKLGVLVSGRPAAFTAFRVNADTGTAVAVAPAAILSSTDRLLGLPQLAESRIAAALTEAKEEWFEDGVESRLFQTLSKLTFAYGFAAISSIEHLLGSLDINVEVVVETMQWLGGVDDPPSHTYRRKLLEKMLLSRRAVRVRHGAASGLAAMDDPSSLPTLIKASKGERNQGLKRYLLLIADQLERTRACLNS
jgi:hypothetical protein